MDKKIEEYYSVPKSLADQMADIQFAYCELARQVKKQAKPSIKREYALKSLQESLHWAISSLATPDSEIFEQGLEAAKIIAEVRDKE